MSQLVRKVSRYTVDQLLGRIFDPGRVEVMVVVSVPSDTGEPRYSVGELRRQLEADSSIDAEIWQLDSPEAAVALSDAGPPGFNCYGGATRVFAPGAQRTDHWRRHPLITCFRTRIHRPRSTRLLRPCRGRFRFRRRIGLSRRGGLRRCRG